MTNRYAELMDPMEHETEDTHTREMKDHKYQRRIDKEIEKCNNAYSEVVHAIELVDDNSTKWRVHLTNGIQLELFIPAGFPFRSPKVNLLNFDDHHGLIKSECEEAWHTASPIGNMLHELYMIVERVMERKRMIKRGRGLLRSVPMMMLWRKRATERLYHPSKIDFAGIMAEGF